MEAERDLKTWFKFSNAFGSWKTPPFLLRQSMTMFIMSAAIGLSTFTPKVGAHPNTVYMFLSWFSCFHGMASFIYSCFLGMAPITISCSNYSLGQSNTASMYVLLHLASSCNFFSSPKYLIASFGSLQTALVVVSMTPCPMQQTQTKSLYFCFDASYALP